jgi:predicted nucleic acid-binding protein
MHDLRGSRGRRLGLSGCEHLVFHFGPDPAYGPACGQLVQQIQNQQLKGFTSTHVLAEVAHRLMVVEVSTLGGWASGNVKRRLKQQPAAVQQLTQFRTAVETILRSKIHVFTIPPGLFADTVVLSQQHGLLTNDALILAVMQANGPTKIASEDSDFDRVPGLTRYGPA